jgi:hypothetical protein
MEIIFQLFPKIDVSETPEAKPRANRNAAAMPRPVKQDSRE